MGTLPEFWLVLANVALAGIVLVPVVAVGGSIAASIFGRSRGRGSRRITLVHIPWVGTVPVLDED